MHCPFSASLSCQVGHKTHLVSIRFLDSTQSNFTIQNQATITLFPKHDKITRAAIPLLFVVQNWVSRHTSCPNLNSNLQSNAYKPQGSTYVHVQILSTHVGTKTHGDHHLTLKKLRKFRKGEAKIGLSCSSKNSLQISKHITILLYTNPSMKRISNIRVQGTTPF